MEVNGALVFPTISELAEKYRVSRRQVVYRSAKSRWPEKRATWEREHALKAHHRKVGRMLAELEKFEGTNLSGARSGPREVMLVFAHYAKLREHQHDVIIPPVILDLLMRVLERAQGVGRVATGLPTDMLKEVARVETRVRELAETAGASRDDELSRMLEKVNQLEGAEFIAAIDRLMGGPPPTVIDVKALQERNNGDRGR